MRTISQDYARPIDWGTTLPLPELAVDLAGWLHAYVNTHVLTPAITELTVIRVGKDRSVTDSGHSGAKASPQAVGAGRLDGHVRVGLIARPPW